VVTSTVEWIILLVFWRPKHPLHGPNWLNHAKLPFIMKQNNPFRQPLIQAYFGLPTLWAKRNS
jgi:hypothetical protein